MWRRSLDARNSNSARAVFASGTLPRENAIPDKQNIWILLRRRRFACSGSTAVGFIHVSLANNSIIKREHGPGLAMKFTIEFELV